MARRIVDAAGVTWRMALSGRSTSYGRDELSLEFQRVDAPADRRYCRFSPRGAKEERYDRVRGLPEHRRLSCSATVQGDLVIDVPQDTVINAQVVRKAADTKIIARDAAVHMCYVEVDEPDMHKPLGDMTVAPTRGVDDERRVGGTIERRGERDGQRGLLEELLGAHERHERPRAVEHRLERRFEPQNLAAQHAERQARGQ